MTLDELLAAPDYQSASPDDRMRRLDEWGVQAKNEAPDEARALDEELPKLRAREYVTAGLPSLGLDRPTLDRFSELYRTAIPVDTTERDELDKYYGEYQAKDAALSAMTPEERLAFGKFSELMDRAGTHYQVAEEARNGPRNVLIDYGHNVKVPMTVRTLMDRKEVTIKYPGGEEETFEYALDEPPPDKVRLLNFLTTHRADKLGAWKPLLDPKLVPEIAPLLEAEPAVRNIAAHAGNAAVDMTMGGIQGLGELNKLAAAATGGNDQEGFVKYAAANLMPLFVKLETGPDGTERWVKRSKDEYLPGMDEAKFKEYASKAAAFATGKAGANEDFLKAMVQDKAVSELVPKLYDAGGVGTVAWRFQGDEDENIPEPQWSKDTPKERNAIAERLATAELNKRQQDRELMQPYPVDPANLLVNTKDKMATEGAWWGPKMLDWLGDKAFNAPTAGQAIGSSLPTLGAAILGGPGAALPFAGLMGAAEGNAAYEDVYRKNLQQGIPEPIALQRALGAGIAYGAVATALEQAGAVFSAKIFTGTVGKTLPGRVGMAFVPESAEEGMQSIAQDLISNANVPDEVKVKAMEMANRSLEAAAGALSFGFIPAGGAILNASRTNPALEEANAQVATNPDLSPEAAAAVTASGQLSLEAEAAALNAAAQRATGAPAPTTAPTTPVTPPITAPPAVTGPAPALDPEALARAAQPLRFDGEQGSAFFRDGQWIMEDGSPAPNAVELEASRQEFIQTGDLGEGMQPESVAAPAPIVPPEAASVAPTPPSVTPAPVQAPIEEQLGHEANRQNYRELVAGIRAWSEANPEMAQTLRDSGGLNMALVGGATDPARNQEARGDLDSLILDDTFDEATGQTNVDRQAALSNLQNYLASLQNAAGQNIQQPSLQSDFEAGKSKTGSPTSSTTSIPISSEANAALQPAQAAPAIQAPVTPEVTAPKAPANEPAKTEDPTKVKAPAISTTPEPQAKTKKPRTARKTRDPRRAAMRTRAFKTNPAIAGDIISRVQDAVGGLLSRPKMATVKEGRKSKEQVDPSQKGEWDWYRSLLEDPQTRAIVDEDVLSESPAATFEEGAKAFGLTPQELGEQIIAAARERARVADELVKGEGMSAEDRAMQSAEQQRVEWEDATSEGKRSVEAADLNPGDVLDVEGTAVRVKDVDLATGEAYLEDGTRFGRQTLANGETIYVESIEEADTTAPELPKFSTDGQPELAFDAPQGTPDEIVAKLDASAATPGITTQKLAEEVQRLSGRNLPAVAAALGLPANPVQIAQQLIAEQRAAKGAKRADEAAPEEKLPARDSNESRELTAEERAQKRKGEPDEAPEGMRPEDMEEDAREETPQPNPFLMASVSGADPQATENSRERKQWARTAKDIFGIEVRPEDIPSPENRFLRISDLPESLQDLAIIGAATRELNKATDMAGNDILETITTPQEDVALEDMEGAFRNALRSQLQKRNDAIARIREKTKSLYSDSEVIQIASNLPTTAEIDAADRWIRATNRPRFSTSSRLIATGVTMDDVKRAMDALRSMLPNATTAWIGTRAEIMAHLRKDRYFQRLWKEAYRNVTGKTEQETDAAFEEMLAKGLDGKEGFTFKGRTYLITDQVGVRASDGSATNAVRRILLHEDAHEGLRHLRDIDPVVEERWQSFRNAIPAEEMDALAKRYPWLTNWRTDATQHDELADEWFAAKIAEIERRGQPAPDSLVGKFIKWIKGLVQKLFAEGHTVTEKELLEFMDAARNARLRARAEAAGDGLRYSASNPSGDMPAARVIQSDLDQADWAQTEEQAQRHSRYDLMSPERRAEYEAYQNDPNISEDLKYLTEFLGDPTNNTRLRQPLAPMIDFTRAIMGGVNGEPAEVNEENTATARQMVHDILSQKTFSARLRDEFQEWNKFLGHEPHAGDAITAVLQMELMMYAVQLAAQTGDTSLMSSLAPFANDVIMGDYVTMSGAARMMQVRSTASRQTGVWSALKQAMKAAENTAEEAVGRKDLDKLKAATDTSTNPELAAEAEAAVEAAVDNTVNGKAVADAVEQADEKPEDYDTDGFWERVLSVYQGTERALLAQFHQELMMLNRELQAIEAAEALLAKNVIQPSMAEDAARLAKNPEELAAMKKRVEERKKKLIDLMTALTTEETSGESKAKRRQTVRDPKTKRAVKALSETAQAQKLIDRFTNRNKRLKRERPAWRKAFEDQIKNPKGEPDFLKTMESHKVGEHTAHRLYLLAEQMRKERAAAKAARESEAVEKTYDKKITGDYTQPARERAADLKRDLKEGRITQAEYDAEIAKLPKGKGPRRTDVKGFISSIAKAITAAPVRMQEDPAWKRQTVINAFMQRGMSQQEAEDAAGKLLSIIDKAIKEAQAKAAIRALKRLGKTKGVDPTKIGEAIRTRGLDPLHPHPVVRALAEQAGYRALTPAQFKRLAELDEDVNTMGPTLAAKAYNEMDRIMSNVRPSKGWAEIITQSWINSALSSIGVLWLNYAHPLYVALWKAGVDLATLAADVATGKTRAIDAPMVISQGLLSWVRALDQLKAEASFALRNDTYRNKILEILTTQHSMAKEMAEAADKIKNGTPKEKVENVAKWLLTTTDFVRRALASADQSWGSALQHYVIQNNALRMLVQRGGLTIEAAATILNKAVSDGQAAMAKHISERGKDFHAEAKLVGKDTMQQALQDAVSTHLRDPLAGEELRTGAEKEAYMELGNRLPESGAWFDPVNGLLEIFKGLGAYIRTKNELAGRMLAGFITVGANILNRSAYFTPLGIGRALYKMNSNKGRTWTDKEGKKLYSETMATEAQARTRLVEGIVGTIGMIAIMMLRKDSDDEEGFVITGQGPTNASVRDAWQKAGHKAAHIEWVGSDKQVKFSIPYSRGGLDHMAIPFTFAGALDDMQLEGRKHEKKNFNWGWAYAGTYLKNTAEQARFFGVANLLSTKPTSLKESSIASNVTRTLAPFIPYSGFMRSMGALFTGSKDKTSWQSATLAQLPITNALMGEPSLNFLGDPVGPQSRDMFTHAMERLEFSGFPFFVGIDTDSANADVYKLILTKGVAPAAPLRSMLESANGFLTDAQWRNYVRTRGRLIKDEIRQQKFKIQFMTTPEAANEMESISRDATKAAKKQLGLD